MDVYDIRGINPAKLVIRDGETLTICKNSITVIAKSMGISTTDFPKPSQERLQNIVKTVGQLDDSYTNYPMEMVVLALMCRGINYRDELLGVLSTMAYYLACHGLRIVRFPNLDERIITLLATWDETNFDYLVETMGSYCRIMTESSEKTLGLTSDTFNGKMSAECDERNFQCLSTVFGTYPSHNTVNIDLSIRLKQLSDSYYSNIHTNDPLNGNYLLLLILDLFRHSATRELLSETAKYFANCGYSIEMVDLTPRDFNLLSDIISRSGEVNVDAIFKALQQGALSKIRLRKYSTSQYEDFPARLLNELEALPTMTEVINRIIRYQMLCSEETRRQDAKEALLVGFKYSLDIST